MDTENALNFPSIRPNSSQKRTNYLNWDAFFISTALLLKDKHDNHDAAVILDNNKIILGSSTSEHDIHAEILALEKAEQYSPNEGQSIYLTTIPCMECAKILVDKGIKEVVYSQNHIRDDFEQVRMYFFSNNVEFRKFESANKTIMIDFSSFSHENNLPLTPT